LDVSQIDLSPFGIKDELIPDISVYVNEAQTESVTAAEQTVDLIDDDDDILKVTEMPDLVIEVLSPRQAISDLLSKFKAYFALGVKSCWLVMPSVKVIKIYSIKGHKICDIQHDADVVDEVMDIRLPIQNIFSGGAKSDRQ
jgi:Uma2 family endonuclease